jgi:DNA-binding transcriptional ArsR family regulator
LTRFLAVEVIRTTYAREREAMPAASPGSDTNLVNSAGNLNGAEEHEHAPERDLRPAPLQDQQTLIEAGELLRALAAPVRIAIVLQLRVSPRCVHELVDTLGVAQPLISQHLRVLKSAGVVHGERHGREVVYRLVDEHLAHIVVDAVAHAEESTRSRGTIGPHTASGSRKETERT